MSPYVRTVKTTSGATAVQMVHSSMSRATIYRKIREYGIVAPAGV